MSSKGILQGYAHDQVEALVGQGHAPVEIDLKHADGQCIGELVEKLFTCLELLLEAGLFWTDLRHGGDHFCDVTVVELDSRSRPTSTSLLPSCSARATYRLGQAT